MIAPWVHKYIGLPFRWRGCDRNGVDCFGLVCMIYREEFGIHIPALDDPDAGALLNIPTRAEILEKRKDTNTWVEVDKKQAMAGDVVLCSIGGHPAHLGIYIGGSRMLHAVEFFSSCIERVDSLVWRYRILGYYRHSERRI